MKESKQTFLGKVSYEWNSMTFFERIVTIATLLSLFLGGAALIIEAMNYGGSIPLQIILTQNAIIIIVIVILLLVYYNKYLKEVSRNKATEEVYEIIGEEFHRMSHDYRNLMISVDSHPQNITDIQASKILIDYCDYIKKMLEVMHQRKIQILLNYQPKKNYGRC